MHAPPPTVAAAPNLGMMILVQNIGNQVGPKVPTLDRQYARRKLVEALLNLVRQLLDRVGELEATNQHHSAREQLRQFPGFL